MLFTRINLEKTNYQEMTSGWQFLQQPDISQLDQIYNDYCRYKKFKSVMPIFSSMYKDSTIDIVGYFDQNQLVAFSLIKKYDTANAEALQFAWTYHKPELNLGIKSLIHECALYKRLGFKFLYLGEFAEYKQKLQGFEVLGPVDKNVFV